MKLKDAKILAENLMAQHGLSGWEFRWFGSKTVFGRCWNNKKLIELSKALVKLNHEERVKNTILHEISHALTPGEGHNSIWKNVARSIGCDGKRLYDASTIIPYNFIGVCLDCQQKFYNLRRTFGAHCTKCYKSKKLFSGKIVWGKRKP